MNRSEVWKLYCAVEFVPMVEASKFVTIEVECQSQTPSLWLRRRHVALCTHYIDDLSPHAPLPLCSYWRHGQEFHNIIAFYIVTDHRFGEGGVTTPEAGSLIIYYYLSTELHGSDELDICCFTENCNTEDLLMEVLANLTTGIHCS
jgi:hypothetical protein